MKLKKFRDYESMSREAAWMVAALIAEKPDSVLCLPSGDTPKRMFDFLVDMKKNGDVDFKRCTFIGLDEWVGYGREDEGSCRYFLDRDFFKPAAIEDKQIYFFDGCKSDIQQECRRIEDYLKSIGTLDLIVLGLGMNGHIGFNEPGTPFDTRVHVTGLHEITKKVAKKYHDYGESIHNGITLGLANIMESKTVILLANGEKKAGIVEKAVSEDVCIDVPASVICTHSNNYMLLDEKAACILSCSVNIDDHGGDV